MPPVKVPAKFIEPMLLLRTEKLSEGDGLLYELLSWMGTALLPSRAGLVPKIETTD